MYLSRLGSGIAMTAALLWIGASCSRSAPQETSNTESTAEQPDSTTAKLAVEDGADQSDEEQSSDADKKPADGQFEKSVTIPLDTIWAWKMPGTKDILDLPLEQLPEKRTSLTPREQRRFIENHFWTPIARALMADSPGWPREGQMAKPGFAVLGTNVEALQGAYDVLVKGDKPRRRFPNGADLSLAFYSYQFGAFIHLRKVELRGSRIEIQYRMVQPLDKVSSVQLALIPLGSLPIGRYEVEIKELAPVRESSNGGFESLPRYLSDRWKAQKFGDRFVSRGFVFHVEDQSSN